MLTLAIIDDEPAARDLIRTVVQEKMPTARIVGEAGSVAEALELLQTANPQIVLLDIALADGSGFDLLQRHPGPMPQIIFITAFNDFAVKAFRFSALDYLVKPFDPADLVAALHKAQSRQYPDFFSAQLSNLMAVNHSRSFDKIALPTAGALHLIPVEDIIRLESNTGYTTIFVQKGEKILLARNIKEFEEMLQDNAFFRIHQSHLVNLHWVEKILYEDGDLAQMRDGIRLPISRRRREAFTASLLALGTVKRI